MESEQMLLAGLVIAIVSVGLVVGVSMIGFEAAPNNNGSTPTSTLEPDVDLLEQSRKPQNWGLLLSDGEILELNNLEGTFVLIDLMSLTCPACETQNDEIVDLRAAMGDSIVVVSLVVTYGIELSQVGAYKSEMGVIWDHGLDTNRVFSEYFDVRVTPTLVLIDSDGYFRMYHEGIWDSTTIQELISLMDR